MVSSLAGDAVASDSRRNLLSRAAWFIGYSLLALRELSPAIWFVSQLWVPWSWASRTSIAVNWAMSWERRASRRVSHRAMWAPRSRLPDSWAGTVGVGGRADGEDARGATHATRP